MMGNGTKETIELREGSNGNSEEDEEALRHLSIETALPSPPGTDMNASIHAYQMWVPHRLLETQYSHIKTRTCYTNTPMQCSANTHM